MKGLEPCTSYDGKRIIVPNCSTIFVDIYSVQKSVIVLHIQTGKPSPLSKENKMLMLLAEIE